MSHLLSKQGLRHLVMERGDVAQAWRDRKWDSLRLLTTNQQTRLPEFAYKGSDPHGFMKAAELVAFLEGFAQHSQTPLLTNTKVTKVRKDGELYSISSTKGDWQARAVIVASGACARPKVPAISREFPASVTQLTPLEYRSPAQIQEGRVLVVGASATGLQFADELKRAGRDVTLAVGEHVRMPRNYRGRDITEWLSLTGIYDQRYNEIDDIARGRNIPSPQLVGNAHKAILDLNSLTDIDVQLTGRLMGINNGVAQFSGSLKNVCMLADLKMRRLLGSIDDYIDAKLQGKAPPAETFADTRISDSPATTLCFARNAINTVIWATGYRPDLPWLELPVFDHKGQVKHDGGVAPEPGLYFMGLPLMRRRKSSYIMGVEDDARDITNHLASYLAN
ncbi:pyridine nucleotide-disulfide oxidoreductase [Paraglaciecola hydrolytica]|uniref:Pyridine nucleotide-disulfide oxidoreductase n=1 Tax=Paraglaciecola hydrolytica TaxID=1799789 RepID=A0A136A750_9ALTE|nr:pyridine nucleotide-disulfide oxidoreductase [Paraglaciecola hydrolytica]